MTQTAFVFSGQGSQYYEMAKELYLKNIHFAYFINLGNAIVEGKTGYSIVKELYFKNNKKSDVFSNILLTHPTLYVIQFALGHALMQHGVKPNLMMGYSLGEIVALAMSGALSFEEGLEIVLQQAKALKTLAPEGGMLAVLESIDKLELLPENLLNTVSIAGLNFEKHFVLSGPNENLKIIEKLFKSHRIASQILPVEIAFHSPAMDLAKNDFCEKLTLIHFKAPRLPIYSPTLNKHLNLEELNSQLVWNVTRQKVNFHQSILNLEKTMQPLYIDCGPSGTMATFIKNILGSSDRVKMICTPFGKDAFNYDTLIKERIKQYVI